MMVQMGDIRAYFNLPDLTKPILITKSDKEQEQDVKEYEFFYSHYDIKNGYMSNFSIHPFKIDGKVFDTVERYMHYMKALLFKDFETADKIMNSKSQQDAKMLGREVKKFNDHDWNKNKKEIVKKGIELKFKQNFTISQQLISTGSKILVEAAGKDRIWGIGYTSTNAMENISKWGQNLLGVILVEVREDLKNNRI
jgi:ribA/ribD-fused uncharacterized protein